MDNVWKVASDKAKNEKGFIKALKKLTCNEGLEI